MTDKTDEAIGRIMEYGGESYRNHPQFGTEVTLIDAIKGEQRQELVRRFAVALVRRDNYGRDKIWECDKKLADAEPEIGGVSDD